jgi:hypothetical protein
MMMQLASVVDPAESTDVKQRPEDVLPVEQECPICMEPMVVSSSDHRVIDCPSHNRNDDTSAGTAEPSTTTSPFLFSSYATSSGATLNTRMGGMTYVPACGHPMHTRCFLDYVRHLIVPPKENNYRALLQSRGGAGTAPGKKETSVTCSCPICRSPILEVVVVHTKKTPLTSARDQHAPADAADSIERRLRVQRAKLTACVVLPICIIATIILAYALVSAFVVV